MWIEVTGQVFNSFRRIIPIGTMLHVDDDRGRALIEKGRAKIISRNLQTEYTNQLNKMKSDKDRADLPPDTKRKTWFGRWFGD